MKEKIEDRIKFLNGWLSDPRVLELESDLPIKSELQFLQSLLLELEANSPEVLESAAYEASKKRGW